jgi:oligopeptide/dipeptide ABC transporter ATP-binding protein
MIWRSCSISVIAVAVMYSAASSSLGRTGDIFTSPQHPYTEALLNAVPCRIRSGSVPDEVLAGEVPSRCTPHPGCHFHTRCPYAEERCRREVPHMREGETRTLRGLSPCARL